MYMMKFVSYSQCGKRRQVVAVSMCGKLGYKKMDEGKKDRKIKKVSKGNKSRKKMGGRGGEWKTRA